MWTRRRERDQDGSGDPWEAHPTGGVRTHPGAPTGPLAGELVVPVAQLNLGQADLAVAFVLQLDP